MNKHMKDNGRRQFIRKGIFASLGILTGGAILSACGSQPGKKDGDAKPPAADPCDLSKLTEEDKKARKSLGYVEKTPVREKRCENCKLFVPAGNGVSCSTCPLFKGPVQPKGYCTYWAPKGM